MKNEDPLKKPEQPSLIGAWLAIGVGLGAAFGNIGVGVALGVAFGAYLDSQAKQRANRDS